VAEPEDVVVEGTLLVEEANSTFLGGLAAGLGAGFGAELTGGLLCAPATDLGVLSEVFPEALLDAG
jgi:hypothetical protein